MNILISNDDGINSGGIRALAEELSKKHNVYIVAPDGERSASSHLLTLHSPVRVAEIPNNFGTKKMWMTSGSPADCVKIALNAILSPEEKPDIVISGINHGPNLGHDIQYSGTVAAAKEAAMSGIPSIAVSLAAIKSDYEDCKFTAKFISYLLDKNIKIPPKTFLNINVPKVKEHEIKGITITKTAERIFSGDYDVISDNKGRIYYWLAGEPVDDYYDNSTDLGAIRENKISITPLCYDLTSFDFIAELANNISNFGLFSYKV